MPRGGRRGIGEVHIPSSPFRPLFYPPLQQKPILMNKLPGIDTPSKVKRQILIREILADFDTPLSTYLKVANQSGTYLFESVTGGDKWGRYSIIGLPCRDVVKFFGHELSIQREGKEIHRQTIDDPLSWIQDFQSSFESVELPGLQSQMRFTGGLVGYFGYETINYIEPTLRNRELPDPLETPDVLLMVSEEVVVFDNLDGRAMIIVHIDPDDDQSRDAGQQRIAEIESMMRAPRPSLAQTAKVKIDDNSFVSHFGQNSFTAGVETIRDYITAGDCMQVVLSQRMSTEFDAHPLDLYRALRMLNPSPYMYYLDLGDHQVVGSSPEILVRLEDNEVTVRPIAGTRPRGATEAEDLAHEESLLADPKELAEHLMLIDLGRNDTGRVAQTGSVKLTEKMCIERYSHVMHIVSNVTGRLKDGLCAMDVLRATFPAGTVSGAPKIRAMQIINELEPLKRGVYSGAVGYLSFNGNMDTAIAIRTAVIKNGELSIQAGAGVVFDSVAQSEWEETLNKARVVFRAAAIAVDGLDQLAQFDPSAESVTGGAG